MKKSMIIVLMLSTFVVGTVELIVAGILELVAKDLHVSASVVGQLITLYALTFAISSPILLSLTKHVERRMLMMVSLLIFIAGNLIAAFSPSYFMLALSRIVLAMSASVFVVVALGVAARLTEEHVRGRALGFVYMGFSAANVLGVPVGTLMGVYIGWRAAFLVIACCSLVILVCLYKILPKLPQDKTNESVSPFTLLKNARVLSILGLTTLLLAGHYVVYAYISPFFTSNGFSLKTVSLILFLAGLSGTIGTSLGGIVTDRIGAIWTLKMAIIGFTVALFLLPASMSSIWLAGVLVIVWNLAIWSTNPPTQYCLIKLAPKSQDLALSLNMSALNIGIALGSSLGGIVLLKLPVENIAWIGGIIGILAFILFFMTIQKENKQSIQKGIHG